MMSHANSVLTMMFWNVGKIINDSVLENKRADYGKKIIPELSAQLLERYGKNFELRNLRRMMQFAELFPDIQIVSPLATLLPLQTTEKIYNRKLLQNIDNK